MGRAFPAPVKRALPVMRLTIIILFSLLATQASAWTPSDAALDIPQEVDVEQRIRPDPNNCNGYYYLKVPLTCGEGNAFNKASLRCDSLENVAKFDPSCGEEVEFLLVGEEAVKAQQEEDPLGEEVQVHLKVHPEVEVKAHPEEGVNVHQEEDHQGEDHQGEDHQGEQVKVHLGVAVKA